MPTPALTQQFIVLVTVHWLVKVGVCWVSTFPRDAPEGSAMRLKLILPSVDPDVHPVPTGCPYPGCGSRQVVRHQPVAKPLRDTRLDQVEAVRYRCVRCGHTFRSYPPGVSRAQTSARLRGVAVMLYVLGLSYGAVSLALSALGHPLSKTSVYHAVQAAGERVPGLRRDAVRLPAGQHMVAALGVDLTSVKCAGQWLTVGVGVDAVHGLALTVDVLAGSEAATLRDWVAEIAAVVGATVLVSDDADAFKTVADDTGLDQQICTAHVVRTTEAWATRMIPELARDADGSLAAIGVLPVQAVDDVAALWTLLRQRQPDEAARTELRAIHHRYQAASPPAKTPGATMSLAYRLRLFSLDRWNLWERLIRYRTWSGPGGERLDGTNNATERAIGWWVKERSRTMRGYKRPVSVTHVSRLIAWAGNQLSGAGAELAIVIP